MRPIRRASLAYVVFFAAIGAGFPYLPVYYRSLGLDLAEIGIMTAVSAATQLVASPLWGALADRFPRSRLSLPAAALVAAAGTYAIAAIPAGVPVLAAVFLLSLGIAGVGPVLDSRTLEILGSDRVRYGQLRGWGSLSFVGVAMAVGFLIEGEGIGSLFVVYGPLYVATALVTLGLPRSGTARSVSVYRGALGLVRSRDVIAFLGAALLVFTALNGVTWFYSIALVDLGGTGSEVGLVWAVGALVEVPIMFAYPRLFARFGATRILVVGAVLFAVRALLSAIATEPWHLVAISPAEGIAYGLFFIAGVDFVARRAPHGLAATAQGLYAATNGIAAIVGAAAGGALAGATSVQLLFAVCGIVGIVGAVAIVAALRVRSATEAPETAGA